jgi:hypothetical protein
MTRADGFSTGPRWNVTQAGHNHATGRDGSSPQETNTGTRGEAQRR